MVSDNLEIRQSAAPPWSNATAPHPANEPRCRCPGRCSARPLSDTRSTKPRRPPTHASTNAGLDSRLATHLLVAERDVVHAAPAQHERAPRLESAAVRANSATSLTLTRHGSFGTSGSQHPTLISLPRSSALRALSLTASPTAATPERGRGSTRRTNPSPRDTDPPVREPERRRSDAPGKAVVCSQIAFAARPGNCACNRKCVTRSFRTRSDHTKGLTSAALRIAGAGFKPATFGL